jgi:LmbE family N-acetylglucosaminyl deacetylase
MHLNPMLVLETPAESDLVPYAACSVLPAQAVLVLAPHADDEVFGCGGAIARHVGIGVAVSVVVLTDGALFGDTRMRQSESCDAAKVLGYGIPEFWNYPDRGLLCDDALVQRLVEKIEQTGADLVYAPSPWEAHPDHRQTYMLAVAAVHRSAPKVRLALYEVAAPLRPNVLLDITDLVEVKRLAMHCFASQLKQQDYAAHMQALNRYRTYTLGPEVLAAEAFWLVSPQELDRTLRESLFSLLSRGNLPQTASAAAIAAPAASAPSLYQRFRNWRAKILS